jgi:hypothetical protein
LRRYRAERRRLGRRNSLRAKKDSIIDPPDLPGEWPDLDEAHAGHTSFAAAPCPRPRGARKVPRLFSAAS